MTSINTNTGTAYRMALTMSVPLFLSRPDGRDAAGEQMPREPFRVVGTAVGDELGELDVATGVEQLVGAVWCRHRRDRVRVRHEAVERQQVGHIAGARDDAPPQLDVGRGQLVQVGAGL